MLNESDFYECVNYDFYHSLGPTLDAITPQYIQSNFIKINAIKYL